MAALADSEKREAEMIIGGGAEVESIDINDSSDALK